MTGKCFEHCLFFCTKYTSTLETQALLLPSHMLTSSSDATVQAGVSHCEPCLHSQSVSFSIFLSHKRTACEVMRVLYILGLGHCCITCLCIVAPWAPRALSGRWWLCNGSVCGFHLLSAPCEERIFVFSSHVTVTSLCTV